MFFHNSYVSAIVKEDYLNAPMYFFVTTDAECTDDQSKYSSEFAEVKCVNKENIGFDNQGIIKVLEDEKSSRVIRIFMNPFS